MTMALFLPYLRRKLILCEVQRKNKNLLHFFRASKGRTLSTDGEEVSESRHDALREKQLVDLINSSYLKDKKLSKDVDREQLELLVNHKKDVGSVSLTSLQSIQGLKAEFLDQLVNHFNNYEATSVASDKPSGFKVKKGHIYPSLDQSTQIDRAVAVILRDDKVTWAEMDRSLSVLDWNETLFSKKVCSKYDHVLYQEEVTEVLSGIPVADVYVMEESLQRYTNVKAAFLSNFNMLQSTLITMLNFDFRQTGKNRVYRVKDRVVTQFAGLNIGGERQVSRNLVYDLINNKDTSFAEGVYIPSSLVSQYKDMHKDMQSSQEDFGCALILAIAFFKLFVLPSHTPLTSNQKNEDKTVSINDSDSDSTEV